MQTVTKIGSRMVGIVLTIIEPATGNGRVKAAKSVNLQSHPSGDNRVAVRYVQALEYLTMQPNLSELILSSRLMGKRSSGNILTSLFIDRPISMTITYGRLLQGKRSATAND
jgi:hypothetical protein